MVSVLLVPAVTLPKSRLALFRDKVPDWDCACWTAALPELNPWQATRKARPGRRSNAPATFTRCFEGIDFAAVSSIVSRGTIAPGSTTVCTRGRAQHYFGRVGRITLDVRGTVRNRQKANRKKSELVYWQKVFLGRPGLDRQIQTVVTNNCDRGIVQTESPRWRQVSGSNYSEPKEQLGIIMRQFAP